MAQAGDAEGWVCGPCTYANHPDCKKGKCSCWHRTPATVEELIREAEGR